MNIGDRSKNEEEFLRRREELAPFVEELSSMGDEEISEKLHLYEFSRKVLDLDQFGNESDYEFFHHSDGSPRFWATALIRADEFWQCYPKDFQDNSIQKQLISILKAHDQLGREIDAAWAGMFDLAQKDLLDDQSATNYSPVRKREFRKASIQANLSKISIDCKPGAKNESLTARIDKIKNRRQIDLLPRFLVNNLWVHPHFPLWLISDSTAIFILFSHINGVKLMGEMEAKQEGHKWLSPEAYKRNLKPDSEFQDKAFTKSPIIDIDRKCRHGIDYFLGFKFQKEISNHIGDYPLGELPGFESREKWEIVSQNLHFIPELREKLKLLVAKLRGG